MHLSATCGEMHNKSFTVREVHMPNDDWGLRNLMLLGESSGEALKKSHVAVFGQGGVGSFATEALARAGVGELTLIDHDTVGITNINRQLCALRSTLGMPKAEVMAARVTDINPGCIVHPVTARYDACTREQLLSSRYDYIIDAIDLVSCKLDLIQSATGNGIPIVSALGTGNKTDPSALRISDISETHMCPLAKVMRKELRKRGITRHRVLWSPEERFVPDLLEEPPPGRRSVPASVCWVPGVAGLMLAGDVVMALTGKTR